MRIGFDAKRLFHNRTGLGNYSRDLIKNLAQHSPKNTYLLYNPKPKKIDSILLKNNVKEILPCGFLNKKMPALWRSKNIVNQIARDNVQMYHGLSGELPWGVENLKTKKVVTIHDLIFCRYPHFYSFWDRKVHFKKFLHAARIADTIIAISEQTKKDIVRFLKIDPQKIQVIYQSCHKVFKKQPQRIFIENTLKKYKIPDRFLLNVGTIEPRKNLLNIVKAFADLDIDLVVVGRKTAYYKKVLQWIEPHQIAHKIHFLQNVSPPELAALYRAAAASLYLSVFEGFGIPIIESLYSATPVITSQGGCFSEAGGAAAFYVNPLSVPDIKNKIQEVLSQGISEKQKKTMSEHLKKFEDTHIADSYLEVYQKLLQGESFR